MLNKEVEKNPKGFVEIHFTSKNETELQDPSEISWSVDLDS
jgi:hypothetical protein